MSDCYTAWWIDDRESNESAAKALGEARPDLNVEFNTPDNLEEFETNPDIILVDWFLDQETASVYEKGISVEAKLRETVDAGTPIYGFSGETNKRSDEQFSDQRFDYGIFERSELSTPNAADILIKDMQSYDKIRDARGEGIQSLLDLLSVPEDDHQAVISVIPREYNDGLPRNGIKHGADLNFARWVRTRFLETPGPLLNTTWAATQLGVTSEAFEEYNHKLASVEVPGEIEYSGVFSHRVEALYWESQLMRALAKLEQKSDIEASFNETWRIGKAVFDADEEQLATCAVCEKRFPQTVAARMPDKEATLPVHYRHSNVHHSREGAFKDHREIARGER